MEYRKFDQTIVLRLDRGDEIIDSICSLIEKENIQLASVSGIGGTDDFTLGVFKSEKHTYNQVNGVGTHEITALIGNINTMDGKPYTHLHMTCAGENGVVAGHLLRCVISLTAEIFVQVLDGTVDRKRNEELQINTFYFEGEER